MALERIVVQELSYSPILDWHLIEQWADGIPVRSENDPKNPEWRPTPVIPLELSAEGYGLIYVKNEADPASNPTQTIKDRAAWELTTLFRDYARGLYLQKKAGLLDENISSLCIPHLSLITAGNVGRAISPFFQKYGLPPMKLLVDVHIPLSRLDLLKQLYADIYQVDLNEKLLTAQEIKMITHNENGVDITSVHVLEPHAIFYDWHVHEVFNESPHQIFVPYGSGRLLENYLTWQQRTIRNDTVGRKDPRLQVPAGKVISIDVFGVEPEQQDSCADKLTKNFNPFTIFDDQDISTLTSFSFTGKQTGVYKVKEKYIVEAQRILLDHSIMAEFSAAAGLALYLQLTDEQKINPRDGKKRLIVNTGKGI